MTPTTTTTSITIVIITIVITIVFVIVISLIVVGITIIFVILNDLIVIAIRVSVKVAVLFLSRSVADWWRYNNVCQIIRAVVRHEGRERVGGIGQPKY